MKQTRKCWNCKREFKRKLKRKCPYCGYTAKSTRSNTCKIVKAEDRKQRKKKKTIIPAWNGDD